MLGWDSQDEIWSRFVFELLIWTQPSGPLCLWQCLNFSTAPCGIHNILSPKMSCKGSFYFLSWISNKPFSMFLDGASYISSAVRKIGQLVCQLICTSCGVPLLVVLVACVIVFSRCWCLHQYIRIFTQWAYMHLWCVCSWRVHAVQDPYKPLPLKRKIGPDSKQNVRSSICQESAGSFS